MSTRALRVLAPVIASCLSWLTAQVAPDDTFDQQVQEMRRQMVEGRRYRSHVRVTVRLKNGNTIRGIVKDGLLVERIDGLHFCVAEADQPGAGIRVYYS